jgi:hypothetical protein
VALREGSWDEWLGGYGLADLYPGWFDHSWDGLCEGGCGWPPSFCNCQAPTPIGSGRAGP